MTNLFQTIFGPSFFCYCGKMWKKKKFGPVKFFPLNPYIPPPGGGVKWKIYTPANVSKHLALIGCGNRQGKLLFKVCTVYHVSTTFSCLWNTEYRKVYLNVGTFSNFLVILILINTYWSSVYVDLSISIIFYTSLLCILYSTTT